MKKKGAILAIAMLLIMLSTSLCFVAGGLTIEETYPRDGSTGASIENLGVKIYFSQDMTESIVGEANKDGFQLMGPDGNRIPTRVLYNEKEEGVVLVLLDNTSDSDVQITGNTEYTLHISGDVVDDQGNTLGEDQEITFTTLNTSTNTLISVLMMVVMFGGMMVVGRKSAQKADEETKKRDDKVNPYKEAKRTGKSVEEIVEKDQKKKAKLAEKEAREAEKDDDDDDYYDDDEVNKYRVARRHSASEAGSKYVAAKKEAAEQARARAAKYQTASKAKKKKK